MTQTSQDTQKSNSSQEESPSPTPITSPSLNHQNTPSSDYAKANAKANENEKDVIASPIVKFVLKYFFFLLAFFITIAVGSILFSSNTQESLEHHPDIRIPKVPKTPGLSQNAHQSPDEKIQNFAFEAVTLRNEIKSLSSQLAITPENEKLYQAISQAAISNQLTPEQQKFIQEQDPQFLPNLLQLTRLYKELKILNLHLTLEFLQTQATSPKSTNNQPTLIPDDVMIKDIKEQIAQENSDIQRINKMTN